jgi:hypothetical protein
MNRWPSDDNRDYRAGPDAAGATRDREAPMRQGPLTEKAPMRQEPLIYCGSLRRRQSGPGGGPLFRSGFKFAADCAERPKELLARPGLTASIPAAQEWRSGQGCLSLRRAAGRRRPRGQSPHGLQTGIASDASAAQEWRSGQGCLSLRRAAGRRRPREPSSHGLLAGIASDASAAQEWRSGQRWLSLRRALTRAEAGPPSRRPR